MKHRSLLFIWAALVVIVLVSILSLNRQGFNMIGKNFAESGNVSWGLDEFYTTIGPSELNPIDPTEAKKQITVTENEIEEHRTRYGALSNQLADIQGQYKDLIEEAKNVSNEVLVNALIEERDIKIEDIKMNFKDDTHVEAKIRTEKEQELAKYLHEVKSGAYSLPIAYELKNVDTGEVFSSGDVSVPSIYKKEFNSGKGYLKAHSLPGQNNDEWTYYDYGNSAIHEDNIEAMANPVQSFEGTVIIPKKAVEKGGVLYAQYTDFNRGKYALYTFWLLSTLALIALFTVLKFRKEWVTGTDYDARYGAMKIDIKVIGMLATALILFMYVDSASSSVVNLLQYPRLGRFGSWTVSFILFGVLPTALLAFQIVHATERWKKKGTIEADLKDSYAVQFMQALQTMFLRRSIGSQTFILLIGFFLAGIGFIGMFIHPILFVIYCLCVLFFALPISFIFVRRAAYLNKIIIATEAMATGRLNEEIKIEGKSPLANHARNLNNLREGVRSSMSEQAKSERLKTELITNVSHDLRTPLTSIITYTDLLKDETITPEDRAKYVDILDKKSQRLKTLIEDLFEVSKMASGNLELHRQRVDLTQLLQQALAEHADDIAQSGLDFRTDIPEEMLTAYVDGQRWWRVLDNLIVNAIKYSLPGTRVYVTLRKTGNMAEFIVKNITKYELGENVDELFERFKRADASRHTDGSGLGLAISQSIVDMHGGTMKIELDGDLFKVTVAIPIS
ncbi:HAMP domain-containing sensor histidine kinase [Sporosarcina oncorhynchi]|uniref:histidine kinase n=1 Tax=Sporosarcina oncorhynchi TaxID=3056444 RepID=A0ABZ0L5D1_9BACL|nr:HAMP domain-containing sensor histidine kinase [Sporosarcina sp. T2O-4]WOV87787.1 HAMP domain-containing sensor histidine kinase [Sporosarcina sp. T2O-4]